MLPKRVFCDHTHLDGSAFTGDPRQVLRRHVEATREESHVLLRLTSSSSTSHLRNLASDQPLSISGATLTSPRDVTGDLRKQTIRTLEQIGIPVEYSFHEDSPSQQEIDLRHDDALTIADSVMTFRHVVREVAAAHGVYATLCPSRSKECRARVCTLTCRSSPAMKMRSTTRPMSTTCHPSQNHLWPVSYNTLQKLQPSQIRQ